MNNYDRAIWNQQLEDDNNQSQFVQVQQPNAKCSVCQKQTNQLLGLICTHDVCIGCAANNYCNDKVIKTSHKDLKIGNSIFWCQLCYEATIIDKSCIDQMNKYLKTLARSTKNPLTVSKKNCLVNSKKPRLKQSNRQTSKNKQLDRNQKNKLQSNKQQRRLPYQSKSQQKIMKKFGNPIESMQFVGNDYHQTNYNRQGYDDYLQLINSHNIQSSHTLCSSDKTQHFGNKRNSRGLSKSNKDSSPYCSTLKVNNNSKSNQQYTCSLHQDQPLGYFCFTCRKPICAQCAINGPHPSHQIHSLRRNPLKLQELFEDLLKEANYYRNTIQSYMKQLDSTIYECNIIYTEHQKAICNKFSKLYEALANKQKELLKQLKENYEKQVKQAKIQGQQFQDLIKCVRKSEKSVRAIFRLEPPQWNLQILQKQRQLLQALNHGTLKNSAQDLQIPKTKDIQLNLIYEAIDIIQQLINKFKLQIRQNIALSKHSPKKAPK